MITILFLDRKDEEHQRNYANIMETLQKSSVRESWTLFDSESGNLVDQNTNLKDIFKLRALKGSDIKNLFKEHKDIQTLMKKNDQYEKEIKNLKDELKEYNLVKQSQLLNVQTNVQINRNVIEKEQEIENLKKINKQQEQIIQDMDTDKAESQSVQNFNQNRMIERNNEIIANLNQESKNLSQELKSQQQKVESLSQQLESKKQEVDNLSQKLESMSVELNQQSKTIENLTKEKEKFQSQSFNIESSCNQTIQEVLQSFYDEEKPMNIYLQHFNLLLEKQLENEKQKIKEPLNNTFLQSTQILQISIQQVTLDIQKFKQCVKDKRIFLLENEYIIQGKKQDIDQDTLIKLKNGLSQEITINNDIYQIKIKESRKKEYQAMHLINNQLVVEGFMSIYNEDLQKTKPQLNKISLELEKDFLIKDEINQQQNQQLNQIRLKLAKHFLIKDQFNQYYICEEVFGDEQNKKYETFTQSTLIHQYINSFILYFYYSMNKNCIITKYELREEDKQPKKLSNIKISHNYFQALSLFYKGNQRIEKLKINNLTQGAYQTFWSEELKKLAEEKRGV
ncbi:unnamed protein product [Paramecium sonneborni]|uniref:Uncharacterized protein n=1 Tax=Paramecium sonneborni TaxID=65129 RepID=A0A8S1MZT5_9CILI|nr:unnamed protein product [Paramecium sonneborni]